MVSPLDVEILGSGHRVVFVHGFTQTRRCWGPVVDVLAPEFELVLVDAPGHGGSASVEADVPTGAGLIGEVGGRAAYVGYSMGGRHLLQLAVDQPDLVEQLALIGTTPGIADAEARRARVEADEVLARRLETAGVEAFLHEWLDQPLFSTLPASAGQLDERRRNTVAGLAASLRLAGTGAQAPLWDQLASLDMPVLLVVGELDDKFRAVAESMADAVGDNATIALIEGAGHAAHLEQPAAVGRTLADWLVGR